MGQRSIEVFVGGDCCNEVLAAIRAQACSDCNVEVRDMRDAKVATDAKSYGVTRAPAVVIDGRLASCCASDGGVDLERLRSLGLGQA